jgi:hypothetical protein
VPLGIILATKVLNTNASTRSCFPEKAASQKTFALRDDPQAGLSENNQFSHATKPTFGPD